MVLRFAIRSTCFPISITSLFLICTIRPTSTCNMYLVIQYDRVDQSRASYGGAIPSPSVQLRLSFRSPVVHDLRRLGWARQVKPLGGRDTSHPHPGSGGWAQRRGRKGGGDELSLAGGVSRTREVVPPDALLWACRWGVPTPSLSPSLPDGQRRRPSHL